MSSLVDLAEQYPVRSSTPIHVKTLKLRIDSALAIVDGVTLDEE